MNRLSIMLIAGLIAAGVQIITAQQNPALDKLFAGAQHTATIEGDLKGAIEDYKAIVGRAGANRALAAQALVRMAEAYQKLGDAEAQKVYQRIVQDYSEQKEAVRVARARLDQARVVDAGVTLKSVMRDGAAGSVSADGRYLAFLDWATGNLSLRDLRAGTQRPLTRRTDFNVGPPVIARDGRFVAYESGNACIERPYTSWHAVLCVLSTEGEGPASARTIFDSADVNGIVPMDWSPDGRLLAVSLRREDRTAQIGIITLADGSLRVLQSVDWRGPTKIVFAPDGRHIAFDLPISEMSDQRDVFALAIDGSHGFAVVSHDSQDIAMAWTHDGAGLLFASDRSGTMGLWMQRLADGKPQGTPELVRANIGGAYSLGLTAVGTLYFAVRNSTRDVTVTPVDLISGRQLAPAARPIQRYVGTTLTPDWSADGKYLAYVSERGFNPTDNTGRIIGIRTIGTGEIRELHPKLLYFNQISWAPDGSALLTAGIDLKGRPGVFTIDTRTNEVTLVVEGVDNAYPRWSTDGRRIFYRRRTADPRRWTLVERDLASGSERAVVEGEFGSFSVSPDGQWLAAPSGGVMGSSAHAVVQIRVSNGETRELLRAGAGDRIPVFTGLPWTPDGRGVLVRKRSPNELWFVPTTGESPRKLDIDVSGWSSGPVGVISLHPDGRQIASTVGSIAGEVMALENFLPTPDAAPRR